MLLLSVMAGGVSHVEKAKRPNTDTIFANIRIGSRGTEHLHCPRRVHCYRARANSDSLYHVDRGAMAPTARLLKCRPLRPHAPSVWCPCGYSLA